MKFACVLMAAAGLATATGVFAGEGHKPKYGGLVQEVNEIQYELVAKSDTLALYVEDHGKPIETQGGSAKLKLLAGTKITEATLAPAGTNKFAASGKFDVAAGTKVVAVVTLGGKSATARFVLK